MTAEKALTIKFSPRANGIRVDVCGVASYANTVTYWQAIVAEVQRCRPSTLLLIDRLSGEALSAGQWQHLVEAMHGQGLETVRIAHVKPEGMEQTEYCQLYALEAGFIARVFDDETQADLWLRHAAF